MGEYSLRDNWPLLPDGTYEVQCERYDNSFVLGKAKKLFLHFKIIQMGEYNGEKLFMAFNVPYNGKFSRGSKYFTAWSQVNDWKPPSRNAKMSPRIFVKKIFKVKTRTVKPMHNGKKTPSSMWYSVVDSIIEVVA